MEVTAVERLAERFVSVTFGGEALASFRPPAPTAHIKLFLPGADGQLAVPTAGPDGLVWPDARPTMRTYTPRRYDTAASTLEVQFALHGDGPASTWAPRAAVGDRAAIGGPGGRFELDPSIRRWWIAGDESAIPAIATLLDALPAEATAQVHLEVQDAGDRVELPAHPGVDVAWHYRTGAAGSELLGAASELPGAGLAGGGDAAFWVACEASAVREIRRLLLAEAGVPRDRVTTRGYWRAGESNHPDHDYGED